MVPPHPLGSRESFQTVKAKATFTFQKHPLGGIGGPTAGAPLGRGHSSGRLSASGQVLTPQNLDLGREHKGSAQGRTTQRLQNCSSETGNRFVIQPDIQTGSFKIMITDKGAVYFLLSIKIKTKALTYWPVRDFRM